MTSLLDQTHNGGVDVASSLLVMNPFILELDDAYPSGEMDGIIVPLFFVLKKSMCRGHKEDEGDNLYDNITWNEANT